MKKETRSKMGAPKQSQRASPRKDVSQLHVSHVSSLDNLAKISRNNLVLQASITGILLLIKREDLVPTQLRKNLTLDALIGQRVFIHLEEMNLEISGVITRTKLIGKEGFHVAIDYSEDAPEYWRECLMDLLPGPEDLD